MSDINLKVLELRKMKGISQLELANILGISFQSISKWENGISMPDIILLPKIAQIFNVSVDQLLGLKPLESEEYIRRNTDHREYWNENSNAVDISKKYFGIRII
ncbi:helix-turn-helix transcriptional regulator [Clostridium perfringens]|uniref:helix-turn-helix domain-containing protein n=1 Tax=Clostridium perfringens TaxID=1502 RepID=UPI0039E8C50E